jgi:hypothetical protein
MAPLRELGEPLMDMSTPQPLAGVHEVARLLFPDGRRYAWHSLYAAELGDAALGTMAEALLAAPSEHSELGIWHLGGAIRDVDDEDTAFGFRDAEFMLTVDAALAVVGLVGEEGRVIRLELIPLVYYGTATGLLTLLFSYVLFPGVF